MKNLKKLITFTLIATLAGTMLLAGCGNNNKVDIPTPVPEPTDPDPEPEPETTEPEEVKTDDVPASDEIKSATLDSAMIQIGTGIFTLNQTTAEDLINNGCFFYGVEYESVSGDPYANEYDELPEAYQVRGPSLTAFMEYQGYPYLVELKNNSTTGQGELKDCVLTSIELDKTDEYGPVYLPQGLTIGDTEESTLASYEKYVYIPLASVAGTHTMYGFYNGTTPVYLMIEIDPYDSTVSAITYTFGEPSNIANFLYEELGHQASTEFKDVYTFPYYVNEAFSPSSPISSESLYSDDTYEELVSIENAVAPSWTKYYLGDITVEEYAEEIKPILEETGFYQTFKDYLENRTHGTTYTYDEEVGFIRDGAGEEAFNLFYWFL